jgi:hypothetical protein
MAHFCPDRGGPAEGSQDMSIDVSDFLRYSLQVYNRPKGGTQ